MKCRYLLDTNICIYIQRHRPATVQARFSRLHPGAAAISLITWGELCYGAEKSNQSRKVFDALDEFASLIPVLPLDQEVGRHYGNVRATLERQGRTIGNNDLWIAAHALSSQLILVTNNEREFSRIDGLPLENWVNSP